jgi:hypothetical protein
LSQGTKQKRTKAEYWCISSQATYVCSKSRREAAQLKNGLNYQSHDFAELSLKQNRELKDRSAFGFVQANYGLNREEAL